MQITIGSPKTVSFTIPPNVNLLLPTLTIQVSRSGLGSYRIWSTIRRVVAATAEQYNYTTKVATFTISAISQTEAGCVYAETYGTDPYPARYLLQTFSQSGLASLVETGAVTWSGCTPGDDEGGDEGGGDEGGGDEESPDSPYGPSTPGDVLPSNPAEPDEPCLPPSYSAPAVPVDTPCDSNSGGTGPGGFGNP
jgi:hypothetical protein